ncbi:hypothetical protein CKAN_01474000 [Cinnamomum micranthum f. kanehirae]|uniref:Uncharacterized protein n=1 Tax=Cinnamomum micranthum f. kanehirae TaxID=337451 RepID=A0A3S3NE61_9MAGN|nr:hypothetical protein CKAN_01474000 [Cinnamomum micranthum f. kanehirae]
MASESVSESNAGSCASDPSPGDLTHTTRKGVVPRRCLVSGALSRLGFPQIPKKGLFPSSKVRDFFCSFVKGTAVIVESGFDRVVFCAGG